MTMLLRAMRVRALLSCLLLGGLGFTTSALAAGPLDGTWLGTLPGPGGTLRVVFSFSNADGQLKGTLASPDQAPGTIPFDTVTLVQNAVHCEVKAINGTYEGTLSSDGQSITGTWTQGPQPLPLTLKPATAEALAPPKRPQTPSPPYPYTSEDVTFSNSAAGIELAGTLTKPKGAGPFPAVLLIAGSGPSTRDEDIFGHKIFLVLADSLTRRGLAVLRMDKRGVGLSKGDLANATTADFVSDASAAVAYLRHRPDIQGRHIGLIGHSEGAMIAPAVAVRSQDVAFLVLIGAPAVRGDVLLQLQQQLIMESMQPHSAAYKTFTAELSKQVMSAVEQEPDEARALQRVHEIWSAQKAQLPASGLSEAEQKEILQQEPAIEPQVKQLISPWMRNFLTYDPAPVLRQLRQPILVLYGSLDLQVPPSQNRPPMEQALKSNKDYTVTEVPGINHVMQPAVTGSPIEYGKIETSIDPKMLGLIGDWTSRHAGLPASTD